MSAALLLTAATALAAANAAGGSAGIFHGGGIAGSANRTRSVHPAWFANAMRFHGGGIAGLRPREVPIIAERGEEILLATIRATSSMAAVPAGPARRAASRFDSSEFGGQRDLVSKGSLPVSGSACC